MKVIIGFIMIMISFLGGLATGVYSIYLKFSNPDMTSTRLLIEYPQPLIYSIIAGIIFHIGYKIANSK